MPGPGIPGGHTGGGRRPASEPGPQHAPHRLPWAVWGGWCLGIVWVLSFCREQPLVSCPQSLEGPRAGVLLGGPSCLDCHQPASQHRLAGGLCGAGPGGAADLGAGQCSPIPTVRGSSGRAVPASLDGTPVLGQPGAWAAFDLGHQRAQPCHYRLGAGLGAQEAREAHLMAGKCSCPGPRSRPWPSGPHTSGPCGWMLGDAEARSGRGLL